MLEDLEGNTADAAIMRVCLFEGLTGSPQFSPASFRVLGQVPNDRFGCARSTELYPDWTFARLKGTDPVLAKRIVLALLAMPRTPDGYAWTVPADYDRVHALFRDLEIGPYEFLSQRTVSGFVRRYRMAFALLILLVLGAALHAYRVEKIVSRRTAELRHALAERDRMTNESRAREEQFEHLSRLGVLGEMASMLAHELNQPLSAIANFAHGIVRRLNAGLTDPQPLADAGEEIARQADRAAGIMQHIRGFARKRPSERVSTDLCEAIDSAMTLFRAMAPGVPEIERVCLDGTEQAAPALIDRLQIEQVLLNLFKNAYDAMQDMPLTARRIRVSLGRDEHCYRVAVRDCGAGLAPDAIDRLFEPFFTTKSEGVGLGLAICKRVIEAHGGHIEARPNTPDPGVTMSFILPAAPAEDVAGDSPPGRFNLVPESP
jgi:two-component system sensor histidine kinase TtrS